MVAQAIGDIYSITIVSLLPGHSRAGVVRMGFTIETGIGIHSRIRKFDPSSGICVKMQSIKLNEVGLPCGDSVN
jgi:hypothetical protein